MSVDLDQALGLAVRAAEAAGEVLRRAFHDPAAPLADVEAERAARAVLAPLGVPVRGEEEGLVGEAGEHVWLVDPCDGTKHFEAGLRGFAVSIALLRGGVPVVAAVYAPCAPDDAGDAFAWREGAPALRNGVPMAPGWREGVSTKTLLLLPPDADRSPFATTTMVAPMRFRAMPSIAYRLALVAAGDADATGSMASPRAHDVAAGHALVTAVGGVVVSPAGEPLSYTSDGVGGGNVLAGAPWVVQRVAKLDPTPVLTARRVDLGDHPYALPRRAARALDPGLLSRAQGCLLGQVAGDSLGSLVEFQGPDSIRARYPNGVRELADGGTFQTLAGQPTDDSEMALALARAIVAKGTYDREAVFARYLAWYDSQPFDIGGATRDGITGCRDHGIEASIRRREKPSTQGNGALMRLAPLAIFGHALPDEAVADLAARDAELTHASHAARSASSIFAVALAFAVREGAPRETVYERALAWARRPEIDPTMRELVERAGTSAPDAYMVHPGWCGLSLHNALHHLLRTDDLLDALAATIAEGGDTDTHAAICGALLGGVLGREAVPRALSRDVLGCRPSVEARSPRPRPPWLWPTDVLSLAEGLLVAGATQVSPRT